MSNTDQFAMTAFAPDPRIHRARDGEQVTRCGLAPIMVLTSEVRDVDEFCVTCDGSAALEEADAMMRGRATKEEEHRND